MRSTPCTRGLCGPQPGSSREAWAASAIAALGSRAARVGALLAALALAGCGGGNSGTPTAAGNGPAAPAAPAPQPALVVNAFSPASGPAGTVVSVTGTGLDGVTGATVGNAPANFAKISATQLSVTVPIGAASGRISVTAGGRTAASGNDFVVAGAAPPPSPVPVPTVATVSPTTVIAGLGRLTLSGSALDQVAGVRLAGTALTIASQSATGLVLQVPGSLAASAAATLSMTDRAGTTRNVAQPIAVLEALAVTGFTPASVARGQAVTINGRGLDRASAVRFGGNASAAVASRSGTTAITAVVPATALNGAVTVIGSTVGAVTEQAVSPASLTVLEPIVVTPQVHNVAAAGTPVTISGTGLAQVNAVQVGTTGATITAQTATALTFAVPAGVTCGAITLRAAGLPDVPAGSVVVGPGCAVRAAAVEFAQLMSQPAGDTYQRLSAGRETWVRAYVTAAAAGTPAPAVRAIGTSGSGQFLGTLNLAGPATLPVLAPAAVVTTAMRYDEATSFNAELPAGWVQPGLRVRIELGDAAAPVATTEAAPLVVASGGLRVVLVPLVSGANAPTLPPAAEVLAEVQRKLPIPAGEISVRVRAPYTLTSVTSGVSESAQWSAALSELERLRDTEAPNDLYYGMVRPMVSAGIAGIGYVNSIGSRSPGLSSLGWDASRTSWRRTMIHELGHNLSRQHAPCGSVSGADSSYPYANGALGPTPLFDVLANDVLSPTGQSDIMGYCNGSWFSDYNLNGVMRFLEARPQALKDVAAKPGSDTDLIVVAGTVDAAGRVDLAPVRTVRADGRPEAPAAADGKYLLRIVMEDGRTIERRFDLVALDHAPGEGHFLLRLAHPGGRLASVEVQGDRRVMAARAARKTTPAGSVTGAPAGPTVGPLAAAGPWAEVARQGDALVLQWDADAKPHATLTLVVAGQRHVLALDAAGGRWRIAAEAVRELPAGGEFEVSLSDGVESVLLVVPRR
ncbi:MAG: IPT/TIG domain-containing protein [Rubrivivax sp.]|nr:IPT/TIG domain-containing protein [Rubrivivax sp.]